MVGDRAPLFEGLLKSVMRIGYCWNVREEPYFSFTTMPVWIRANFGRCVYVCLFGGLGASEAPFLDTNLNQKDLSESYSSLSETWSRHSLLFHPLSTLRNTPTCIYLKISCPLSDSYVMSKLEFGGYLIMVTNLRY